MDKSYGFCSLKEYAFLLLEVINKQGHKCKMVFSIGKRRKKDGNEIGRMDCILEVTNLFSVGNSFIYVK